MSPEEFEEKESEYIKKINLMQIEIDEDNEIIEKSYNFINELKTQLALSGNCSGKKGVSSKQAKDYEEKIVELERCVSLFSVESLNSKKDEIETLLKRAIKLKVEIDAIKELKRIKKDDMMTIESGLYGLQQDLVTKYLNIFSTIEGLNNSKLEVDTEKYIFELNSVLDVVNNIFKFRALEIQKLKADKEGLRGIIKDFSESGDTLEELRDIIKQRDQEISNYKIKIAGLEHDIKNESLAKNDK